MQIEQSQLLEQLSEGVRSTTYNNKMMVMMMMMMMMYRMCEMSSIFSMKVTPKRLDKTRNCSDNHLKYASPKYLYRAELLNGFASYLLLLCPKC